ncbi:MAG: cell envelope integrity EipB family protein [Methylovirgula sp.]
MVECPVELRAASHPARRAVTATGAASLLAVLISSPLLAGDNTVLKATPAGMQASIDAIPLASHRAVYDLTLLKAVGSKSPTEARGRIAFDFSGSACEGYVQNFRQVTELQPAEGPTRVSDMRSATFEDGSGKSFAFKMETRIDDEQSDEVDGRAQRDATGPVSVDLTKPKEARLALGRHVLFPTEHLKYILAAAEAGERSLEVEVYDGSDTGDKIYETTTFIGRPIDTPATGPAAQIPVLEHMRRWPVSISYFDPGNKDESPDYTLSFELYENGISRALRLDYGDFVLAGEMKSLKLLPTPPCPK